MLIVMFVGAARKLGKRKSCGLARERGRESSVYITSLWKFLQHTPTCTLIGDLRVRRRQIKKRVAMNR